MVSLRTTLLSLTATLFFASTSYGQQTTSYTIDDTLGGARVLDGIGGLSGGGATCKFLEEFI